MRKSQPQHRNKSGGGSGRTSNPAITLNKKIIELGRKNQWKELLLLHQKEKESFNNVNYATTMSQLGRIRFVNREHALFSLFVSDLASQMETRGLAWMEVRQTANIMHALGKMKLKSSSAKSIATLVSRKRNAEWLVNEGDPQNIANTAWAFATLGVPSPHLFSEIERHAQWLVENGLPQAIANTAWSCASLGVQSPKLLSEIDKHAKRFVADGLPQNIANTAWSCATLGVQSPKLFAEIEEHAEWFVEEAKPQDIANTAWSCATLGVQSHKLIAEIEMHAQWLVENGLPQHIANTAWSCATLGVQSHKLFAEIEMHAQWLVENGLPQHIANTAWSCATLGVQSPKLFAEIDKHAKWFVENGLLQAIANTAWSCATLGVQSPKLFAEIETHAEWIVRNGNSRDVSNTAWSCATLGVQSPKLFAEIDKHAKRFVDKGLPQDISNTAWSCATLGVPLPKLFSEIEKHAMWLVENGLPQHIVNICYAIQILDIGRIYKSSLSALWDKALSAKIKELSNEDFSQLVVVDSIAKTNRIQLQAPPSELRARMGNVKVSERRSNYEKKVSAVLKEIGFAHEEEVSPLEDSGTGGMLSIDLACKERQVAIECDGPSHYLRDVGSNNISRVENGSTKAKRRFLERSGWTVVNLNYQDWIAANKKGKARDWLCQKLTDAGVDWSENKKHVP